MTRTVWLCLIFMFTTWGAKAQDSLWVRQKEGKPYLLHKVKTGETLFLLSKKYGVPPAVLADANQVNYQAGLPAGSKFRIPIDDYNFLQAESVKSMPIYYRAGEEDDLVSISRMFNVSQSRIQWWNNMGMPDVATGDVLQVGWIAYDKTQVPFADIKTTPVASTTPPKPAMPVKATPIIKKKTDSIIAKNTLNNDADSVAHTSPFEALYNQQTAGLSVTEESGAAVFYPLKTKAGPGVYYAFHNTAARGSILKIMNPANGRIIFAKVIGTLPSLKEYHNAVVGLSNNVIHALGAQDQRMFCKIKYR